MSTNQMRVVFTFNESELAKFNKLLIDANIQAKVLDKELEDVGNESTKAFSQATNGVNQLVTGVKAFLALELVNRMASFAIEASKAAAQGEAIRNAYSNLGGTADQMDALTAAVGGTVSQLDLMAISVKALQKGVKMDELAKGLKLVDAQADATGESMEALSDIFINSIGKESTQGLNKLGISEKAVAENAKKMGFMPALMQEIEKATLAMGDSADTTADSYDQLATAQKNFTDAFGRFINSGPVQQVLGSLAKGLDNITKSISGDQIRGTQDQLIAQYEESLKKTAELEKEFAANTGIFGGIKRADLNDQLQEQKELRLKINSELIKQEKQMNAAALKEETDAKLTAEQDAADKAKKIHENYLDNVWELNRQHELREEEQQLKAKEKILQDGLKAEQELKDLILDPESRLNKVESDITQVDLMDELDFPEPEEVDQIFLPIKKVGNDFEDNFDKALGSAEQMVAILNGLDSDDSGFKKTLIALSTATQFLSLLGVGGTGDNAGKGFGMASRLLRLFIPFLNEGGMVGQPIGPNKDSVVAGLTLGEYVVKRDSTKRSPLLLDAINSGELDDSFLKKLNVSPTITLNQEQVVAAIQRIPQPDFYKIGSVLFESRMDSYGNRISRKQRLTL